MAAKPINSRLNLGQDHTQAHTWIRHELAPVLAAANFDIAGASESTTTFERRYLPGWALVLGILTLPIGLLLLVFARNTDVVAISLNRERDWIIASVNGMGPTKVQSLFERLARDGVAMHMTDMPPPPSTNQKEKI
jgi:hypothetical protein